MKSGNSTKNIILTLALGLFGWLLMAARHTEASPPIEIKFAKGATGSTWTGTIKDGNQKFKLYLGKGQTLKVGGEDVYSWFVITPKGNKLGCDEGEYCPPESELTPLPYTGGYIINTDYRMSSCASCPTAKARKVTVTFEAK